MGYSNNYKLSASILASNFSNLSEDIKNLKHYGCNEIHYDVMDGNFVDEISMGPVILNSIKDIIELPVEVHLMVSNPEKNIEQFSKHNVEIITFHYESTDNHNSIINLIKSKGLKVGIALNPLTDVENIYDFIGMIDRVLMMSVDPGFSGQKFNPNTPKKIKILRDYLDNLNLDKTIDICVDGGINNSNIKQCKDAGANIFVSGSSIFWNGNIKSNIMSLMSSLEIKK
ncbi:MAG: ribulose-phosphate 3-epimerase [Dehalococcoidia bacterium]|nr:ribulose-phosphate 3-epimerase [Chloroflexota bacterium]|tara:strand:+ start:14362 stop:15045 length:684 start_codon:yes stop_codon:yes gene_type:complete